MLTVTRRLVTSCSSQDQTRLDSSFRRTRPKKSRCPCQDWPLPAELLKSARALAREREKHRRRHFSPSPALLGSIGKLAEPGNRSFSFSAPASCSQVAGPLPSAAVSFCFDVQVSVRCHFGHLKTFPRLAPCSQQVQVQVGTGE